LKNLDSAVKSNPRTGTPDPRPMPPMPSVTPGATEPFKPKPPDPTSGGPIPGPNIPRRQFEPKMSPSSPRANEGMMRDFAKSVEKWWPKSMSDSPAMKKMLSNLEGKDWGKIADSTFGKTGKGPNINWNKVGNRLQGTGRFFDRNLPTVSGRRL